MENNPLVDGLEMVPQGTAGTGQAFILPADYTTPLQRLDEYGERRRVKAEQQAELEKKLKQPDDWKLDVPTGIYRDDVEVVAQDYSNLVDRAAAMRQAYFDQTGSMQGWDKPGSPYYKEIQDLQANFLLNAERSKQDVDVVKQLRNILDDPVKKSELTTEGIARVENWLELPPRERWKTPRPNLDAYWDWRKFADDSVQEFARANTSAWSNWTPEGVAKGSKESVTEQQLMDLAKGHLLNEPRYATHVQEVIAGYDDEKEDRMIREAGELGMSLPEYVAFEEIRGAAYDKYTSGKSRSGGMGYGGQMDRDAAQYLLDFSAGLATGTYEGYEPLEGAALFGTTTIEPGRYLIASNLPDYQTGEEDTFGVKKKRKLQSTIYDTKTGKVAIYEDGVDPESANWLDQKEFFAKYTQPIAEFSKEYKFPAVLQEAREADIISKTGDVDLEKYAGGSAKAKTRKPAGW